MIIKFIGEDSGFMVSDSRVNRWEIFGYTEDCKRKLRERQKA